MVQVLWGSRSTWAHIRAQQLTATVSHSLDCSVAPSRLRAADSLEMLVLKVLLKVDLQIIISVRVSTVQCETTYQAVYSWSRDRLGLIKQGGSNNES